MMKLNDLGTLENGTSDKFFSESDSILKKLTASSKNKTKTYFLLWAVNILMIIMVGLLVYFTGGTKNVFVHLMYIPIIYSVFVFGVKGGIFSSIFADLIIGPYMPVDVAEGTMQEFFPWTLRLVMFIIIVLVVGILTDYIGKINDLEKKKAYEDVFTGYPNLNKFKLDLNHLFMDKKQKTFTLLLFQFENMDIINRYVNYEIGQQSLVEILTMADQFFIDGVIYAINSNEFLVFLPECNCDSAYSIAKDFSHKMKQPIYINELPIAVITKGGLVSFPLHGLNTNDIFEKLEKALDQACISRNDIMIYDEKFAKESGEYYNTLISLYHAVQTDTFVLMYQPKVSLLNNELVGVEALLRWNDITYSNIPISNVIKIAEDADFISQITKWVIKNAMLQLKTWQKEGIETKIAINLSSKDLRDNSIIEFTRECLKLYQIEPSLLEFELTERSIIDDEKVFHHLKEIKKLGISISLDDYGTGHNSLIYLIKLPFKFDNIKIDKLFIDEIKNVNNRILIEGIIKAAHGLGIKVIAEGIEVEEQLNILKTIGCDIIQGYYFSKPLSPKDAKEFILMKYCSE